MLENYIDLTIIFYLALYFISGLRKTLPNAISELLSLAIAIVISFSTFKITADFFAKNLQMASAYANIAGFFLNTFIFKVFLLFAFDALFKKADNPFGEWDIFFKRFISGMLSLLYGVLTAVIMFSIILSLSLPSFITAEITNSKFGNAAQRDPFKINEKFKKIFGEVYDQTLKDFSFMNIKTGPEGKFDLGFKTMEFTVDTQSEEKMLELVNQERIPRGLKALQINEEARRAARDYGRYLFQNGVFSHTDLEGKGPSDRIKNYKVEYMILGENLAYAPDLEKAHQGLMNSKGHRENILNPFFSHVGIGVIDAGDYGKIYVQEFWG